MADDTNPYMQYKRAASPGGGDASPAAGPENPYKKFTNNAPGKVYYNDAGQPFTLNGEPPPPQTTDAGYTGNILPLRRDAAGHMSLAVPDMIAAPFRGAVEGGKALAGNGPAPGQPLSPDVIAAEAPFASPIRFGVGMTPFEQKIELPSSTPAERLGSKAANVLSGKFTEGQTAGGPNAMDVIERLTAARKEGQPLTLADIRENPPLQRMIGTIYRQGGEAATQLKKFFESRNLEASDRVRKLINEQLSDGNMRETTKQLIDTRSNNARPLWKAAEDVGPLNSDYLQRLLTNPRVKSGIKRGLEIYRDKADAANVPFEPNEYAVTGFNEAGDPTIGPVPTMKLWMIAKEGLDALAESPGMKDPLTGKPTKEGLAIIELRNGLVNELDQRNPAYVAARQAWSGDTASIRAVEEGRHAFDNKWFTPEELGEHFNSLSDSDKQFFFLGLADDLKAKLSRTVDAADKAKAIINNDDARMRIRALKTDPEQAERFINAIERERVMKATPQEVMGGSPTAERQAADRLSGIAGHGARAVHELVTGHPINALRSGLRAAGHYADRPNMGLNSELVRLLTNPDVTISGVPGTPLVYPMRPPGIGAPP